MPIVTAAAKEIKSVLGGTLGATLVESTDPDWTRDPDLEVMKVDFRRARPARAGVHARPALLPGT